MVGQVAPSVVPERTMEGTPQTPVGTSIHLSIVAHPNDSSVFCALHAQRAMGDHSPLPFDPEGLSSGFWILEF